MLLLFHLENHMFLTIIICINNYYTYSILTVNPQPFTDVGYCRKTEEGVESKTHPSSEIPLLQTVCLTKKPRTYKNTYSQTLGMSGWTLSPTHYVRRFGSPKQVGYRHLIKNGRGWITWMIYRCWQQWLWSVRNCALICLIRRLAVLARRGIEDSLK